MEEFLAREQQAGHLQLELKPIAHKTALLHGHCLRKSDQDPALRLDYSNAFELD